MLQPENDCDKYPPGAHCGECEECVRALTNEELRAKVKKGLF